MRKLLFASAAVTALMAAAPAVAKDGSWYLGGDIGAVWPKDQNVRADVDFADPDAVDIVNADVADLEYKAGIDAAIYAGYDFGMFRAEGEIGYKHGKVKDLELDNDFLDDISDQRGSLLDNDSFDIDKTTNVWSAMINGWLDFGGNGGFGGGIGAGVGYAGVHQFGHSDGKLAWQLLANAYYPVSEQFDIGLKYRFFHAGGGDHEQDFAFSAPSVCNAVPPDVCSGGTAVFTDNSKFSSHSLLLSFVYNFAPPPPPPPPPPHPPPPPPPPPATQTCPDGSVILATDVCPAPPPPPPPPPPEPVRGR